MAPATGFMGDMPIVSGQAILYFEALAAAPGGEVGTLEPLTPRACQQLDTGIALVRLVCALLVATMSVLYAPLSRPVALMAALAAAAYSAYSLSAGGKRHRGSDPRLAGLRSVAVDGVLALGTYLLFVSDPLAMPVAFVPLLVFELTARFAARGVLLAFLVMAVALGGRIYVQTQVLAQGAVRLSLLLLWLAVGVLMVAFGCYFRAHERHCLAVARERGRVAESFRAIIEQVLARYGVQPGSAALSEVEQTLAEICSGRSPERQQLITRLTELIATARDDLGLTRREQEIASLLARGYSCAGIAAELVVSQSTVRNHIHNIKRKLGTGTRDEVIALFRGEARSPGAPGRPAPPAKERDSGAASACHQGVSTRLSPAAPGKRVVP